MQRRKNMNLITRMALAEYTDAELAALFALISRELAQAEQGSLEWHGGMISLENIRREQGKRRIIVRPKPRGPGF
jgi:hypothetical protein